jgi:hypothetical protein
MSTALNKITTRAKQLRKKHPHMEWKTAIKKAGVEYRGGKIKSAPRKKAVHRKTVKRKKHHKNWGTVREHERRVSGTSISGLHSELKKHYKNKLAKALLERDMATTKRERTKRSKEVTKARSQLKKIS